MMRWIVIFTNKANSDAIREANLAAHLDYFSQQNAITLAGSTTPLGATQSNGGVWIIKDVSYEAAKEICEADPFFVAGLREKIEILAYGVAPKFDDLV